MGYLAKNRDYGKFREAIVILFHREEVEERSGRGGRRRDVKCETQGVNS